MPNVTVTTMVMCDRKLESTGNILCPTQSVITKNSEPPLDWRVRVKRSPVTDTDST